MKFLLLFLLLIAVAAADSILPETESLRLNHEAKEKFDSLVLTTLHDADSVVISGLLPLVKDELASASIADPKQVQDLVIHIRAEVSNEPWYLGTLKKETVRYQLSIPCQCWGEFEFSFYRKEVLIASFSAHHQRHIRSKILTSGADVVLEKNSIERIYAIAFKALPSYGEAYKKANQSLVPTPVPVTTAADAPVAPATGAAHL